jgi:malate permease and related proteins
VLELVLKLIPLLVLIVIGYIAGRFLNVTREWLAPLLIYILAPLTIFKGVVDAQLNPTLISLPFIYIALCSLICGIAWFFGKYFFRSPALNILAYSAGNSNSGYFGFPVAIALLGHQAFPTAVMISFGFVIYEATLGFYITARGHHTARESLQKLLKLPVLYVFIVGLAFNGVGISLEGPAFEFFDWIKGSFSTLGMMLIGIALSQIKNARIDWAFTSFALITKFVLWPLVTAALFWVDELTPVEIFDTSIRQSMWLVAFLPMAANSVAFASLLRAEPEKCAVAVLISTLVGMLLLLVIGV